MSDDRSTREGKIGDKPIDERLEELAGDDAPEGLEHYTELSSAVTELSADDRSYEVPNRIESLDLLDCDDPLTREIYAQKLRRIHTDE